MHGYIKQPEQKRLFKSEYVTVAWTPSVIGSILMFKLGLFLLDPFGQIGMLLPLKAIGELRFSLLDHHLTLFGGCFSGEMT